MAIDYTKHADESIDQYNSRIAAARGDSSTANNTATNTATSTATNPAPTSSSETDSFINQLQQKLLGQSDIISSENTNLENKINDAISSIKSGQQASSQAITSQYDRQIADAQQQGQQQLTSFEESQRGFAHNTAALQKLQDDTSKQLKDLEQRKQELILQGQATAAGQISQLQVQAIQFQQQAQQQVFSNLLAMGGFAQQQQQNNLAARSQNFQEQNAMATLALQYGVQVNPNDTLQDVVNRAKPLASKAQQLQLDQLQSEIDNNRAQTAKAYADAQSGAAVTDPTLIDTLARGALNSNGASLALIKDPITYAKVVNRMKTMQQEDIAQTVTQLKQEGINKAGARNQAQQQYGDNPQLLSVALDEIDKQYGADAAPQSGAGFVSPSSESAFVNAKPLPPASPAAIKQLQSALLGTAFHPIR